MAPLRSRTVPVCGSTRSLRQPRMPTFKIARSVETEILPTIPLRCKPTSPILLPASKVRSGFHPRIPSIFPSSRRRGFRLSPRRARGYTWPALATGCIRRHQIPQLCPLSDSRGFNPFSAMEPFSAFGLTPTQPAPAAFSPANGSSSTLAPISWARRVRARITHKRRPSSADAIPGPFRIRSRTCAIPCRHPPLICDAPCLTTVKAVRPQADRSTRTTRAGRWATDLRRTTFAAVSP